MSLHPQTRLRRDIGQVLADLKHLDLSGLVQYDSPKRPVARGGFGEVYRGKYESADGSSAKVAIKCLTVYLDGTRDTLSIFKRELRAWSRLKHTNVLRLLGFMLEETGDPNLVSPSLISEWMEQGNVLEFVRRNPGCDLARLTLGMANGLAYLHEQNIVHSDFKSANVLVSDAQETVICDFGSSHISHSLFTFSSDVTGFRGTFRWMAYELLAQPEKYTRATKASDTWAFGMTVYEIMTNEIPYAHIGIEAQVLMLIVNRKLPSPSTKPREGCKKRLWDICTSCWAWEPAERPSMAEVSHSIRNIEESSQPVAEHVSTKPTEPDFVGGSMIMKQWRSELPHLDLTSEVTDMSPMPFRSGGFADDFIAKCRGVKVTARRVRHFSTGDPEWSETALKRMRELARAPPHPNVEELLGFTSEKGDSFLPLTLVFHFVGTQDIQSYVRNNPRCNIVEMLVQVARGLAYLHDRDVIHGGLETSNIIVNEEGTPCISGLCYTGMLTRDESSATPERPSTRWTAIGLFSSDMFRVTKQADIWAFGMTIYELLSGHVPYFHIRNEVRVILAIANGELPPCPENFDSWPHSWKSVWAVCQKCWEKEPSNRPTIVPLVKALEGIQAMQIVTETDEAYLVSPNPNGRQHPKSSVESGSPGDSLIHLPIPVEISSSEDSFTPVPHHLQCPEDFRDSTVSFQSLAQGGIPVMQSMTDMDVTPLVSSSSNGRQYPKNSEEPGSSEASVPPPVRHPSQRPADSRNSVVSFQHPAHLDRNRQVELVSMASQAQSAKDTEGDVEDKVLTLEQQPPKLGTRFSFLSKFLHRLNCAR